MSWVLVASAALAWAFHRADANERRHSTELLNRLSTEEAIVPDLWNRQVVNALLVAQRRSVMSTARCRDFLARLGALPILAQAPRRTRSTASSTCPGSSV